MSIAEAAPQSQEDPDPSSAYFRCFPDAWRVNDALRQLSVSRATLYKMAKDGEIRLARIGGRTLVPDAEIKRLVGGVSRSA
jgi:excisionase family DNA binding protein